MNLFDQLVNEALKNQPDLNTLKIAVEKELLHHDILRILSEDNLLSKLTFIGGTCLRTCYGAACLSEDLDFTGGAHFSKKSLSTMSKTLVKCLNEKYNFPVTVSEPVKDSKNVSTWKIKIETRAPQKHLPAQRIHIDICAVPSYEKKPMLLLNPYGVEMGTSGLIIQAESREEIYTDKLLAFALRPNRIQHRDLWDMMWLHQKNIKPSFNLISKKLSDRDLNFKYFFAQYETRQKQLAQDKNLKTGFYTEMQRFLPSDIIKKTMNQDEIWQFILYLMADLKKQIK